MRVVDITGDRHGMLLVLEKLDEKKGSTYLYNVQCDCGNSVKLTAREVRGAKANKSCGCMQYKGTPKDITGKKLNKLTAVRSTGEKSSNGDFIWEFMCDCGEYTKVSIGNFNSGHTKSCGCAYTDSRKGRDDYHGMSSSGEYATWLRIKSRTRNCNDPSYANYGEIGIGISDEWFNSFTRFYEDMGKKPSSEHSIDRIDNTKGYFSENCRWASQQEQARNKLGLQNNNMSGVKGVHWDEKSEGSLYAVAQWKDMDGTHRSKSFSVKTYGEELAFFLACEYREHQIELLNKQGAGYSEQHLMNERHERW